jgi:hypothetical protein
VVYSCRKSLGLFGDRSISKGKAFLMIILHPDRERLLNIREFALGALNRGQATILWE